MKETTIQIGSAILMGESAIDADIFSLASLLRTLRKTKNIYDRVQIGERCLSIVGELEAYIADCFRAPMGTTAGYHGIQDVLSKVQKELDEERAKTKWRSPSFNKKRGRKKNSSPLWKKSRKKGQEMNPTNKQLKRSLYLILFFAWAVSAQQTAAPKLTPTEVQTLRLQVKQKDAIIAQQALLSAQNAYQTSINALNDEANKVKKENGWDDKVQFNQVDLSFASPNNPPPEPKKEEPKK